MNEQSGTQLVVALGVLLVIGSAGFAAIGVDGEASDPQQSTAVQSEETWISDYVFRTTDEEAGVVCYVGNVPDGAGIDCLPLEQTRLADTDGRTTEVTNRTDDATDRPNSATAERGNRTTTEVTGQGTTDATG